MAGHSDSVLSVAFSPDGKHVVSGSADMLVKIWNAKTGVEVSSFCCSIGLRFAGVWGEGGLAGVLADGILAFDPVPADAVAVGTGVPRL